MTRTSLFTLALAFAAFGMPAYAQDEDIAGGGADPEFEGNVGGIIINGLTINTVQDLDFGTIVPNATLAGTVLVRRGSNNNSECSAELICLKPGTRARFRVTGEPNRVVDYSNPTQITISNAAGDTMIVDTFTGAGSGNDTSYRGFQTLRSSGLARFNVGASLQVNPDQPLGVYTGTFTITASYQ
ncbi:MAG: DUF4402 domain-containing protein [Pseudomonadota bacterium]